MSSPTEPTVPGLHGPARTGLGRAGQGLPTVAVLEFQLAAARARDAVKAALDADALATALGGAIIVASQAPDLPTHLQRPDLGRQLAPADLARLTRGDWDLAIVIGDGLSAPAAATHAPPLVAALLPRLAGWRIAPPVIARHARVAIGDDIGAALDARMVLVLIGERPGLSAPDSLGAYLTFAPRRGCLDSQRNCVSNIRPSGFDPRHAAHRLAWLLGEARQRGLTGVGLKEAASAQLPDQARPASLVSTGGEPD